MIAPLLIGAGGIAILISLGVWQIERLAWKEAILADIEARIAAPAGPLPAPGTAPEPYQPVAVEGVIEGRELHVLVSRRDAGAGYRIVSALETEGGRRILVDRGFVPMEAKDTGRPATRVSVEGNLHEPDERLASTPANDIERNIWFARDVPQMAKTLGTEPLLLIARTPTGQGVDPMPVGTEGIPNDHLEYAITWFSLALVWLGMTLYWLWRITARRRDDGPRDA